MFEATCVDAGVSHAWGWFLAGSVYPIELGVDGRTFAHVRLSDTFTQRVLLSEADYSKCFVQIDEPVQA